MRKAWQHKKKLIIFFVSISVIKTNTKKPVLLTKLTKELIIYRIQLYLQRYRLKGQ